MCVPACLPQLPTTEKEDENAEAGGDGGEEEEEPQREEVTEVSSLSHPVYEEPPQWSMEQKFVQQSKELDTLSNHI